MIIRKIKPEEIKRTEELFSIAFEFPYAEEREPFDVYADIISHPDTRGNFYWKERWAAFEDDDKTMMSYFVATPFPVNFDGHTYTMTGIGGVSTLPQYRRSGGIRNCFKEALPDMYESGVTFSYLYPFSTSYYRKFGYELCCNRARYQLKMDMLPTFPNSGSCYMVDQNVDALHDIKEIYDKWQNKYNMMIVNEDFEYQWLKKTNPYKDQIFTYVYKDEENIPRGYVSFKKEDEQTGRNIHCTKFVYSNLDGFKGLITLLKSLSSDHNYLFLELPMDEFVLPLFPEWAMGAASRSISQCGMARVINVRNVLEHCKYKGSGDISIEIIDPYIKENSGVFHVIFKNGKASTVTLTETKNADIVLSINDFSRLIIGICESENLPYLENIKIFGDLDTIKKVFYKKPNCILEYF